MKKVVLIVEDNPLIAGAVSMLVEDVLHCTAIATPTVGEAMELLNGPVALAILDIEVADGVTYPLASRMLQLGIPFVFASGTDPKGVPSNLARVRFLRKPVTSATLLAAAQNCL